MYMFSAVSNRPVLQQDLVPELAELRDNWRMIREEAQSFRARRDQGRRQI
jgi:aspartyl/asparaginyl beta-hydroxylase (cupin superfamily)